MDGLGFVGGGVGMFGWVGIGARGCEGEHKIKGIDIYIVATNSIKYIVSTTLACFSQRGSESSPDVKKGVQSSSLCVRDYNGMHGKKNIDIDIDIDMVKPVQCFFFFSFLLFSHAGNAERAKRERKKQCTMECSMRAREREILFRTKQRQDKVSEDVRSERIGGERGGGSGIINVSI